MLVDIYWNSRNNCYSVKSRDTGKVIDYTQTCGIINPRFVVSQAGRNRVLREKRKNVHALIRGKFTGYDSGSFYLMDTHYKFAEVSYNPYKFGYFYDRETLARIDKADIALLRAFNGKPIIEAYLRII